MIESCIIFTKQRGEGEEKEGRREEGGGESERGRYIVWCMCGETVSLSLKETTDIVRGEETDRRTSIRNIG